MALFRRQPRRFGWALNAHSHLHSCVNDGMLGLDPPGIRGFDFDQSPPRDPITSELGFAFDQTVP